MSTASNPADARSRTPPEAPARTLQVGLGARGRKWAQIVRQSPLAHPVGYVDPRPDARAWAAADGGAGVPVFAHLHNALDAVAAEMALVVTPPDGRLAVVQALVDHGLHVLSEKPLALALADAVAMVRAAERAGRCLGVVQNFRYLPVSQVLRERIRSGRYGVPTYGLVTYIRNRDGHAPHLNKYPLVMDHPMLLEQSVHHLDLLRFVYDAEPEDVSCITWNPRASQYQGDACAAALIRLRGGLPVVYHGTWVSGSNLMEFQWRTDLERGVIIQRQLFGDLVEGAVSDTELHPVPVPRSDPFVTDSLALLDDFIAAYRHGAPFSSSGRDHLQTLALTLACAESAHSGQQVSLSDFSRRHGLETGV